jgi:hypothetical protein
MVNFHASVKIAENAASDSGEFPPAGRIAEVRYLCHHDRVFPLLLGMEDQTALNTAWPRLHATPAVLAAWRDHARVVMDGTQVEELAHLTVMVAFRGIALRDLCDNLWWRCADNTTSGR